jgi:hypothetical protein
MRSSIAIGAAGVLTIGIASFAATRSLSDPSADAVVVVSSGKASGAPFAPHPISAPSASLRATLSGEQNTAAAPTASARQMAASGTWWRPAVSDTWQWQLTGTIKTSYDADIYDLDLFTTKDATFATLRSQGRKIMCYFSAGSSEDWRDDYKDFAAADKGSALDGWQGERWVNIRSQGVRRIMLARLDLAASRGCDGVEPDNVDGYANKNGLGLTADDQLDYNRFLATEAHRRGLAVALKNDLDQIPELVASFDVAVNEQCNEYSECDTLKPFLAAGKPVLNAEYQAKYRKNTNGARDKLCKSAKAANIRTLVLPLDLDGTYRYACD